MNIFLELNYRVILRKVVEERKAVDTHFTFQAIAEAARIPKSYVSKVTTEKAHFSADQLYLVCEHLGFSEQQMSYMALLLEHERSTVKKRRASILEEIHAIRDQALDSRAHLKARPDSIGDQGLRDYYLDPINQLVHICLSIARYQTDIGALSNDLTIPTSELRQVIARLEELGFVEQEHGKIRTVIKSIHLPRSSPAYRPWRTQLKLMSIERLDRRPRKDDYSFSVTFSATDKIRDQIKGEFLELLKRTESAVSHGKQSEAYQMSFDLFSWTSMSR